MGRQLFLQPHQTGGLLAAMGALPDMVRYLGRSQAVAVCQQDTIT